MCSQSLLSRARVWKRAENRRVILDQFRLDGRTALVTGASAGLGAAIAIALAQVGANVVCHGNSRSPQPTCNQIERLGKKAVPVQADLSKVAGAEELFTKAFEFAPIDILVNNAGTIRRAKAAEYSDEDWNAVLQVNLNSVWKLCRAAGHAFLARGSGGKI